MSQRVLPTARAKGSRVHRCKKMRNQKHRLARAYTFEALKIMSKLLPDEAANNKLRDQLS